MIRRSLIVFATALVTMVVVAPAATAQGEHFTKQGVPRCTDIGTQLVCTGELAGLGNEDLVIDVSSTALVQANCVNPGGNEAPGQNKVVRAVSAPTTTVPASAIKNGRAKFTTNPTAAPSAPTATEAGCPNKNWSTRVVAVTFSNVRLTISQGGDLLFTCSAPSVPENGSVTLSCTRA